MVKTLLLAIFVVLAMAKMYTGNANSSDQIRSYKYAFGALTVEVKNPLEAYPNQTINVNITSRASAKLIVNYTAIELYTFSNSTRKDEKFSSIVYVDEENPVLLFGGGSLDETSYDITIPNYASNIVYGKLILLWMEKGTEEATAYERESTFVMLYLGNPELEWLRSRVPALEKENAQLKHNVASLNDSLTKLENENSELRDNITSLNNSLTELSNNLTDIRNRYEEELSGTRSAVTVLAITTVSFLATTAFLFLRKLKQHS